MNNLIGITGYKRHGKDTIGKYLVDFRGYTRISFADTLKEVCSHAFGIPTSVFHDDAQKDLPSATYPSYTNRQLLQLTGTELFRDRWPTIWIDRAKEKIRTHTKVVVCDVRFFNEVDAIKELGGEMWRVYNPRLMSSGDNHASEISIGHFAVDKEIINDSSLFDLAAKVEKALTQ